MRILIADDNAQRYVRLLQALSGIGIQRNQIDIVGCANAARDELQATRYDLFLLDILLPLWPEGEPDVQHSLDLLLELQEGADHQKPGRILGITVDLSLARETVTKLEEWTWTVVQYSESSDEWINRIQNCVRYIVTEGGPAAASNDQASVDLAIVCALATPELEEILKLPWNWSSPRPINDLVFVHDGTCLSDGRPIRVCATSVARMGMVSTALVSAAVISLLQPRLIVMCGICAGVRGKAKIGDVLFADPAWDFQSGKRVREKGKAKFAMAPHQLHPPEVIRSHIEQIRVDTLALGRMSTAFGSDAPGVSSIVIGPVASGSAVLADGQVVEEIKAQHRELVGVEMEIYGLYAAAHAACRPQPLPFALKGVCDFADSNKSDDSQQYAAYASANVLRILMERFGSRLLA